METNQNHDYLQTCNESDDFSLQTNRQTLRHNIYIIIIISLLHPIQVGLPGISLLTFQLHHPYNQHHHHYHHPHPNRNHHHSHLITIVIIITLITLLITIILIPIVIIVTIITIVITITLITIVIINNLTSYKFPLALSTISCLCDCPGGASQCTR